MVANPAGAVPIFDGGTPRIITAKTAVGVTGGQLVFLSGANNVVSSGADTFVATDLEVGGLASGLQFNGIVITPGNTASGGFVAIGTAGTYVLTCDGSVFGGQPLMVGFTAATSSVSALGSTAVPTASDDPGMAGKKIGRALSNATSGNYCVATLTP